MRVRLTVLGVWACLLLLGWMAGNVRGETPAGEFRTLPGFKVELVHPVSESGQGSWVALCLDPKQRIIASDQYGGLYRVTLDSSGKAHSEKLDINIGMAQGLLYAFDSLYININARSNQLKGTLAEGPGVYRLTDTDGDDQFDKVEYIVPLSDKAGEHGPHALVLSPDGKKIYFCAGNQTDVPETCKGGPVPRLWDEDHLLGRMPDGRGFMAGRLAPGGFIIRMDPDGSNQELIANGFRNEYDMAFNFDGELFTYDADMEWDIGTPWYRPTRVNHVISGAEFGWRNGTGKWPEYYGDSFGAVVNVGPGSPTGVTFGYGLKFPNKYQHAFFIGDWSYGIIYAVHLQPDGASYTGEIETFLTAAPMPVTDMVVHPDGNLYFAVGGRRTASALYRVRYEGDESTQFVPPNDPPEVIEARALRRKLESYHGRQAPEAVDLALEHIGSPDRAIRFAARVALEHQPVVQWRDKALALQEPRALINASYALSRTRTEEVKDELLARLNQIDFASLDRQTKLELLRAVDLVYIRLGAPNEAQRQAAIQQFDRFFPGPDSLVNRELALTLVYLRAPGIVRRCVQQMRTANAQEDQIHYAFCLRNVKEGWDPEARRAYFQWFFDMASARGGASFGGFLANIRKEALSNLTEQQRKELGELAGQLPSPRDPLEDLKPRKFVRKWTVDELMKELAKVKATPDFERGRELTAAAQCFKCHRFNGTGGIQGPDLTGVGKRFSLQDLVTHTLEPSKEISDQYQATQFLTEDGVVVGRVANLHDNRLSIVTNMLAPGDFTQIDVDSIIEQRPSPVSMMPTGLLDTFTAEEIAQILYFLRSGGQPNHEIYTGGNQSGAAQP